MTEPPTGAAAWPPSSIEEWVVERLERAQLRGSAFDHDAVVDDLRSRIDLDAELDELLGPDDVIGDARVPEDDSRRGDSGRGTSEGAQ